ncbi:AAA family ATPase [Gorillibacterium sp. CAU 1737]|uniref:AAA family ATPase n=1 Tax=Gorillibacterium sp. CAU 1737 TaxID=3140362 RepID=UPI00326087D2
MQKLVFFVGVAGTGKSTVAAKLAVETSVVYLDRDTLGGRFVEAMLKGQGLDPDDRDSDYYKKNLRDLEYDTTEDVCVENVKLGQDVFMISPFTQELKNKNWLEGLLQKAGKSRNEVKVKVVVVTLSDSEAQRKRILARGTSRDEWKLEHWDEYWQSLRFVPEINWELNESDVLQFDNSGELTTEKLAKVKAFIEQ